MRVRLRARTYPLANAVLACGPTSLALARRACLLCDSDVIDEASHFPFSCALLRVARGTLLADVRLCQPGDPRAALPT